MTAKGGIGQLVWFALNTKIKVFENFFAKCVPEDFEQK